MTVNILVKHPRNGLTPSTLFVPICVLTSPNGIFMSLLGVTGQNIPPAGIYPGLKRPRLDYTRVYYGLDQFIPPQAKIHLHYINHDINSVERYTHDLFFQQVTED